MDAVATRSLGARSAYRQAVPVGDYYRILLEPSTRTNAIVTPLQVNDSLLVTAQNEGISSTSSAGGAAAAKPLYINGILIPPRPFEPENCCMSGCINCVWDTYGDELEIWASQKRSAEGMAAGGGGVLDGPNASPARGAGPIVDNVIANGKRDADVVTENAVGDDSGHGDEVDHNDLFVDVPVGIREFMKQEKRLKEKRAKAVAAGDGPRDMVGFKE